MLKNAEPAGSDGTALQLAPPSVVFIIVEAPIAFLDDLPPNITSVRKSVPSATLIHFIADPRLAKLLGAADDCDYRIDTWPEAHEALSQALSP